jgi:hypothetical protein
MLLNSDRTFLVLSTLTIPLAHSQLVSSLPQCIQNCINQSQDSNCEVTDVACLCRASAGNFLPDLITCMHGECDNSLDNNLLLTPLQLACEIAGAPIPASAIRNAENEASSLAAQVTATVTLGGSSATGDSGATTTVSMPPSISTETFTKTESGSTVYLLYPITLDSTTTVSGDPSTVTSISAEASARTYTTTDAGGSTVEGTSTYTQTTRLSSSGAASSSISSTKTFTTSVRAAETSSSNSSASKTSAKSPQTTNSSPFTTTNGNGGCKRTAGNWFGLSVLLAVCCLWF